jgi:hypothetical protein
MLNIKFSSSEDEIRYYHSAIELLRQDIKKKETKLQRLKNDPELSRRKIEAEKENGFLNMHMDSVV